MKKSLSIKFILIFLSLFIPMACNEISELPLKNTPNITDTPENNLVPQMKTPSAPSGETQIDQTPESKKTSPPPSPDLFPCCATPTDWKTFLDPAPEQMSILLLGSDKRSDKSFRTDVIQFLVVRPDSESANIVSFPRDLYVFIPGVGPERINTVFSIGGFELMKSTFTNNFGLQPDHYVMTDFTGFKEVIDTLGGIEVEVERELKDKCDLPTGSQGFCQVGPGTVFMDGETALWYVRSRYSTSDFDRGIRSQEVIGGITKKLISIDAISNAPEIVTTLLDSVETDLTIGQILAITPILPGLLQPDHTKRYSIGPSLGSPYTLPDSGNWVFLPDIIGIQNILQQAMYFP